MNASLVAAGALMGLSASAHCAVMCGAPCAALARSCGGTRPYRALAAWHAGRLVAYSAAGAVAAASVGLLAGSAAASAILAPLWAVAQSAMLVLGAALVWSGRMPRFLDAWAQAIARALRPRPAIRFFPSSGVPAAAASGLAWVALPCGVLYAALAVAALADGAAMGAMVMAAFSLGSAIGLVGAPLLLRHLFRLERVGALRLAGALLVLGSGWALWHGMDRFGAGCLGA